MHNIERLSFRQHEVAVLVCKDMRTKEIAAKLGLSLGTVEKHIENIMRIMGVHSRVGLALKYIEARGNKTLEEI